MTEIERLLFLWNDGALSEAEIRRLTELLDEPGARRLLVQEFIDHAMLKAEAEHMGANCPGFEGLMESRAPILLRFSLSLAALLAVVAIGVAVRFLTSSQTVRTDTPALLSPNAAVVRSGRLLSPTPDQFLPLQPGDIVNARGPAALTYRDGTRVELQPDVEVRVLRADGKRLEVRRGAVAVVAAKQPADRPMVLETPMANAIVVGTRFTLKANPGATWLRVAEGQVRFAPTGAPGGPVLVSGGQVSVAALGVDPAPRSDGGDGLSGPPILVTWESAVAKGDGQWQASPDGRLTQSKLTDHRTRPTLYGTPSDPTSTIDAPVAISGSVLVEAAVQVNQALEIPPSPMPNWQGFACRLGIRDQIVKLYFIDYGRTGMLDLSVARTEAGSNGVDLAIDQCPRFGVGAYRMKLLLSRVSDSRVQVSGKLWTGDAEPPDWMVRAEIPLRESVHRIGFETTHCACTFRDIRLSLVP